MKSLIDCMILLVSLCLSNSKVSKTIKSGKIGKRNYSNKSLQYPRKVTYDFSKYHNELLKGESVQIIKQPHDNQVQYIKRFYNDSGLYQHQEISSF